MRHIDETQTLLKPNSADRGNGSEVAYLLAPKGSEHAMDLYIFSSVNWANIQIGYEHKLWAVSIAEETVMKARRTRAKRVEIGSRGVLYCKKRFTVPFNIRSKPALYEPAPLIWPEPKPWAMPFQIEPLGSPERWCLAHTFAILLASNGGHGGRNLSELFPVQGTKVFSPMQIGEDEWTLLMKLLAKR